jgi:hypothetical protein
VLFVTQDVVLTKIFQISVNTGTIPDEWRSALIVPVFKKGDRHQASNYRPVSLTTIACKRMAIEEDLLQSVLEEVLGPL